MDEGISPDRAGLLDAGDDAHHPQQQCDQMLGEI